MNILHYFQYNNYLNRTIKGYDTLSDYQYNGAEVGTSEAVNFNKTNEIEASVTAVIDFEQNGFPDYVIVTEENGTIVSRWFVISKTRNRKGNWNFQLKRDSVYDNLSIIINNEETIIERGNIEENTNSAVLNSENNFGFNEIKQNEYKLQKTSDECGWLVIFVNSKQAYKKVLGANEDDAIYFSKPSGTNFDSSSLTYSITLSDSTTEENFSTNDFKNRGYMAIAIPMSIFKSENSSLNFKYYIGENFYSFGNYEFDFEGTFSTDINSEDILNFINEYIIPNNELFIDMQVLPEICGENELYYYYTEGDETTRIISNSIKFPIATFNYYDTNGFGKAFSFPVITNMEFETVVQPAVYINNLESTIGTKSLEAYKCFLESPDRSSNLELDLRYFASRSTNNSYSDVDFKESFKLQPFQTFIYVMPNVDNDSYFGYTNDSDLQDGKYLICGYNNQILRTSDAWLSFLMNNKNYLNSFNLEMRDAKINTATGAIASGITGATTGAIVGSAVPVVGTAIGAVVGGAIGATTAIVQGAINMNEKKKQFEWSCDNIKSKPQTVSKISTFTPINSIYPTLSIYYNEEVVGDDGLFEKYLKLNGMTVNKIGKIDDYILTNYNYISAKILRLNNFYGTTEELKDIQDEVSQGLYFDIK